MNNFELKKSIGPIVYQPIIISGLLVFYLFIAFKTQSWSWKPLVAIAIAYGISVSWAYSVRRYKVFYRDGEVGMRPLGATKDTTIPIKDIEAVRKEFSFEVSRTPQRIALYAHSPNGEHKYVDISLKHFEKSDINKLLDEIRRQRPDLEVPSV